MAFTGSLTDLPFVELLDFVARSADRGANVVVWKEGDAQQGLVCIQEGRVVQALTDSMRQPLRDRLVAEELVAPEAVSELLQLELRQTLPQNLVPALMHWPRIDGDRLLCLVRGELERAMSEMLTWQAGRFSVLTADPIPQRPGMGLPLEYFYAPGVPVSVLLHDLAHRLRVAAVTAPAEPAAALAEESVTASVTPVRELPSEALPEPVAAVVPAWQAPALVEPGQSDTMTLNGLRLPTLSSRRKQLLEELRRIATPEQLQDFLVQAAEAACSGGTLYMVGDDGPVAVRKFGTTSAAEQDTHAGTGITTFGALALLWRCLSTEALDLALLDSGAGQRIAFAIPMIVLNRPRFVLYGESPARQADGSKIELLELLVQHAGLKLENLLLRRQLRRRRLQRVPSVAA